MIDIDQDGVVLASGIGRVEADLGLGQRKEIIAHDLAAIIGAERWVKRFRFHNCIFVVRALSR
ncbi:hypothetical protein [Hyphomonas sp.]|uniref:hypothetical protein n=1 Tax=Hyphomonas sp. TaxID=87 RepID=UPI0030F4F87A